MPERGRRLRSGGLSVGVGSLFVGVGDLPGTWPLAAPPTETTAGRPTVRSTEAMPPRRHSATSTRLSL
ncbi:hypothetical protein MRX96_043923 [Rhipicephalus microplus]